MANDGIDLEAELDQLYGLPAAEFVAARNQLAKRLRQAGERAASDRTKKLSRPSVTAWAVNQLAFRASAELDGLKAAGEKVRAAHLAGPKEQQAAARARRDAISTLRVIAEVALQEVGVSPNRGHRQRISQTLEVLSSQGSEADQPRAGRLSADLEPAGFDALTDLAAALAASQKARPPAPARPAVLAPAKPAVARTPAPKPPRPKVVEHPAAKQAQDPEARRAAARRAPERRELDRRRQQSQVKLEQLEEKTADLDAEAERAASGFEQAKRAEAALMEAAREAERLAVKARARVEAAARVTAQARRESESAAGARRRARAEIEKAQGELAEIETVRDKLRSPQGGMR